MLFNSKEKRFNLAIIIIKINNLFANLYPVERKANTTV